MSLKDPAAVWRVDYRCQSAGGEGRLAPCPTDSHWRQWRQRGEPDAGLVQNESQQALLTTGCG